MEVAPSSTLVGHRRRSSDYLPVDEAAPLKTSDVALNPTLAAHPTLPLRPAAAVSCPTDTVSCSPPFQDTTPAPSTETKSSRPLGPPPRPPRNPLRPLMVRSKPQAIDVCSANACGPKCYDPMTASVIYLDTSTPTLSSANNGTSSELSPPSAPYDHFQDVTRIKSDSVRPLSHANNACTQVELHKLPSAKRESRVGSKRPNLAGSPAVVCASETAECAICEKMLPMSPNSRHGKRASRIRTSALSRAHGPAIGVDSPLTPFSAASTWSQDSAIHSPFTCDTEEHEHDDCGGEPEDHDDPYDGDGELDDNEPPCQRDTYLW